MTGYELPILVSEAIALPNCATTRLDQNAELIFSVMFLLVSKGFDSSANDVFNVYSLNLNVHKSRQINIKKFP